MKLNAVAVASKNLNRTIKYYSILGFEFPGLAKGEKHIESVEVSRSIKLMIDSFDMLKEILGENPKPGNHSNFAILYDDPDEIDKIVKNLSQNGFTIVKKPWDAFWGQRYAIVADPDGYKVDLYAYLK